MKRFLLTLLLALSLGIGAVWAETASISFSAGLDVSSLDLDDFINISIIKDNGSADPKIYTDHVRFYGGNKMTISAKDAIISQVVFNTGSSNPFKAAATATTGTLTTSNTNTKTTWEPASADDKISSFSISNGTGNSTGQIRITSIEVTYEPTTSLLNPGLSYPSQTVNVNLGEEVVNELVNPYNVPVVYASTNNEVATVNPDGSVTILGVGKSVISATSQKDDTYREGYAAYTLVVKDPNAKPYRLVTSVDELYDGAMAIIVSSAKGDAMSITQNSNNRGVAPVTIIDNEVTPSDDVAIVRINIVDDKYTLYVTNGESTGYLYHPSNNNYLRTQDTAAEASISFSGNDVLIGFDGSYKIKRNSSSTIYSCYTSAQTAIQLYVIPNNLKDVSIAFDSQSYETVEGKTFKDAILSGVPEGVEVSYNCSNPEIASVDASTGVVTALKGGKVTITATSTATSEYKAGKASYELVIKKVGVPEISPLTAEVNEDGFLTVGPADFIADVKNFAITSSDKDVFDVEYDGTECTFLAFSEGSVTLTATWDAGDIYAAGSKDFEFTVKPLGPLAAPVFEPVSGTYELREIVSISAPAGATIYYGIGTTKADATQVYKEEFKLETLGDVTYVAYAKKDDRESDIVTVTYNVVKADVDFGFEQSEYTVKMGTMPSELPVPSASLNYTLSSSNTSVASLDPVIGAELWLLAPGDTEITATYAGSDTTNPATAKYTLHVIEEGTPATEASVTFNFLDMTTEKYGLENAETEVRNTEKYFKTGATATQGDVTIVLNKKNDSNGWRILSEKDLRVYTNSDASMTISVGTGIITSIDFNGANSGTIKKYTVNGGAEITPAVMTRFTVDCTGLNTGTIIFTPTVGKNGVIGNVTVHYTIPGIPATHTSPNLVMKDDREVLVDAETAIEGAFVAADVEQSVVNYLVLDAEGTLLDNDFVVTPNTSDNSINVLATAEEGEYRLVAYIEPSDKYYPAIAEVPLYVRSMITPAELYIHGHFYNRYYDLTDPVEMKKNGKVFTANDILIGGNEEHADDNFDFVFSSHKLDRADAPEQSMMRAAAAAGSHQWAALTEGYVYHNATGTTLTATPASAIEEAADIIPMHDGNDPKGKAGLYQFSVDFTNPAEPTYVAEYTGNITTGVEGIVVDNAAEAVYYDLTGRRVLNPTAGVVIRVQGGKAEKIMIK